MSGKYTDISIYHYTPTEAWCIAFVVLFGVSAAVHSFQAYRSKYWVIYPTLVLGALIEVIGWSGRLWSSKNVLYLTPFLMQICTLILSPVFFSAYIYYLLGQAITTLGPQFSILKPKLYFGIFICADIISLILQAIGGGQAASSAATSAPTTSATNIMVAGIIFQLVSMGIFIACALDFFVRAQSNRAYEFRERSLIRQAEKGKLGALEKGRADSETSITQNESAGPVVDGEERRRQLSRWWILMIGVGISSLMIFVRGIYRSIELVQGWDGYLISNEIYQNTLDGIPMVIAVSIFNIIHPGYLLPQRSSWKGYH